MDGIPAPREISRTDRPLAISAQIFAARAAL
jgi:hypothetical protein